ncbi:MAG TPA: SDR family oxidoreductase [Amycolatopsis sp.]|nr:SDR family oxidoreductase [Amycolatopsis sp.]
MTPAPAELFTLHDRVALVTGASSGLGEHLTRTLAAAGAKVAAVARRLDRLEKLAAEVPGVLPVACDITSEDDLRSLVGTVRDKLGPVDVLVNNAGVVGEIAQAQDEDPAVFRHVLEVNLTAPARLAGLVLPDMRERGAGSIIGIGSISGLVGIGKLPQASYAASKSGLIGLTRELALQWARYGVRVNAIAAGYFESEMTQPLYEEPELAKWVRGNTPLRRRGHPQDFAGALLLLASDAGGYMTGHTLVVDGGWTAR